MYTDTHTCIQGRRKGGEGNCPPDLLKNSLYISSKLLINVVKGHLPLLTETTFGFYYICIANLSTGRQIYFYQKMGPTY